MLSFWVFFLVSRWKTWEQEFSKGQLHVWVDTYVETCSCWPSRSSNQDLRWSTLNHLIFSSYKLFYSSDSIDNNRSIYNVPDFFLDLFYREWREEKLMLLLSQGRKQDVLLYSLNLASSLCIQDPDQYAKPLS